MVRGGLRVPGGGRWRGLLLVFVAGCQQGANEPCAQGLTTGDHQRVAVTCEQRFAESGDPAAGLQALRARAALADLPAAEALAARLRDSSVGPDVLVQMTELYVTLKDPRASAEAARATNLLSAAGHHARAAVTARLQTRPAWAGARYQEALAALSRSLTEAQRATDLELAAKARLGQFLILYELGDLRNAGRVLAAAEADAARLDPDTRALLALNRGLLADAEGNTGLSRVALEKALQLTGKKSGSEISWSAHLNLFELALTTRDLAWAARAHQAAERLYRGGGFERRATSRIAFGYYTGQLRRLQRRPDQALALLQSLSADEPNANWRWKIALERGLCLMALDRQDEAVAALEEAAAVVEDLRGEQRDEHKSWALAGRRTPFVELFEHHAARAEVKPALQILERVQGRTFLEAFASNTAGLASSEQTYADTALRVESLKSLIPALRSSAMVPPRPLPWNQLSAGVRRDDLVAFFEGRERLYVVALRRGQPHLHRTDVPLAQLRRLIAQFLERPDDRALAERLGELILPPGTLPPPGGRIYLAPTALLARVPLGALRVNGRYLAEQFTLSQIPSLNALLALRRRPLGASAALPVVLANARGDLPGAEAEGRAVAGRLQSGAQIYLGSQATSRRLREARGIPLLHLALHSGVGPTGPWLGLHDRRVTAAELLEWGVGADLVVLSSCASAATPDPGLWGSLAASFLAAGSRSVIGSLWTTRDEVTREFVEQVYRQGPTEDPARALAEAQRAWIARDRPPSDWAAFAFFGAGPDRSRASQRPVTGPLQTIPATVSASTRR